MTIFGVYVELPILIIGAAVLLLLIVLVILAVKGGKGKPVEDPDKREVYGDFHGLLTQDDFDKRADDPMLEIYRMQWIKAAPGDEKDNHLLLYLALKQLNKEQDESEEEWTQEQCEARMDEIVAELSEKTGLKLLVSDASEEELEETEEEFDEEDADGTDEPDNEEAEPEDEEKR